MNNRDLTLFAKLHVLRTRLCLTPGKPYSTDYRLVSQKRNDNLVKAICSHFVVVWLELTSLVLGYIRVAGLGK